MKTIAVALLVSGLAASFVHGKDFTVSPVEGDATATLQKAFDDCFLSGGGTVTVEKGEYKVKGLRLRSDTTLFLKSGAVLKASRNCDDYCILDADRIEPVPQADFAPGVVWVSARKRTDMKFEQLVILGGHDGIHFSSSDRVRISDCLMKTGDDCVAGFDNEDVEVTRCVFNTACSAFRFGGRRVLVENCLGWGPGEYPIRNSLPIEDRISGSHGTTGKGRRTMLSIFTYYSDFSIAVRHPAGDIVMRNCSFDNVERFLHYNFSGNEVWQKNRPLSSIRFEGMKATKVGMSLCAYGDDAAKLSLGLKDCHIAFAEPQKEFIRACHVERILLDNVAVEGVDGPCVRSWGDVAEPEVRNLHGVASAVVVAETEFKTKSI